MPKEVIHNLTETYNNKALERERASYAFWKQIEREHFLDYIREEKIHDLLEIGAGPGKDSLFFNESGIQTISTDISPEMVNLCLEKGLPARVMSFTDLTFKEESFSSVWAMNCLLHIPKEEIRKVLEGIKRVLKPEGLFYIGVYGGKDFEGVWAEDTYEPKRFFSFYENQAIKDLLSEFFTIEYFAIVTKEVVGGEYDFQSIIVRKKSGC